MPEPSSRIARDDVAHVARLARLALTDDELDVYTDQLGAVLEHAADLDELDLDAVEPMTHPYPLRNVLRPDVPGPTLDRDEVLASAPDTSDGQFSVPAILGEAP